MVLTYLHFRILEFPLIGWNSIFENEEIGRSDGGGGVFPRLKS